jgi:hypothetical protein
LFESEKETVLLGPKIDEITCKKIEHLFKYKKYPVKVEKSQLPYR